MAVELVDSYSETNWGGDVFITDAAFRGQTFHNTNEAPLHSCKAFLIRGIDAAEGNIYAYIYAHTGTYGSTGKPTGSYLAISDPVDVSAIGTESSLILFSFSGANKITLAANTNYCLVFKRDNDTVGVISAGWDYSSPSHGGNYCYGADPTWYADSITDVIFYVYSGEEEEPEPSTNMGNFLMMFYP